MNKKALVAIVLLLAFGAGYWFYTENSSKDNRFSQAGSSAPKFRKDGVLSFKTPADSTIAMIDIEIADEDWEISQGLMYRPKMASNRGMLFIFPDVRPRSFWMRNTIISLDIIFANANKEIVTIQKYTTPYSEDSVPSLEDAQYVVEVNAGFCDKHGIEKGHLVEFDR